jgi:hypothetical protein
MFKLIIIAVASIGQIDRRLLANGVGQLGPLELDPFPTVHLRDLVAHEAHRHPYIEILGTMYLMKLRYAKHFGNRAGSAWRLVFLYALLPWMHQYRILEGENGSEEVLEKGRSHLKRLAKMNNRTWPLRTLQFLVARWRQWTDDSRRLPTLVGSSSMNARALEVENQRLNQMVKRLSQHLRDSQMASEHLLNYDG